MDADSQLDGSAAPDEVGAHLEQVPIIDCQERALEDDDLEAWQMDTPRALRSQMDGAELEGAVVPFEQVKIS